METSRLQMNKPQITGKGITITILCWLMYTLVSTVLLVSSEPVPFVGALIGMGLSSSLMVVLMIPSWYLIVREAYHRSWWIKLALHLIAGVAFTTAWYYLYLFIFDLIIGAELLGPGFTEESGWIMFSTFTIYVITFAVIHTIESRKELRIKKKQADELKKASRRQEIATLKAQINPHFLFNTLNSINATVTKSPEQTRAMIAKLSEMLRYSLNSFDKKEVSLSDEIDFVKTYLSLEKKRLGERLNIEYSIDNNLENITVPPMILQPLVENATKHGIAPQEDGGTIILQIRQHNHQLYFRIEDTGQGIDHNNPVSNTNGIGLKNTNEMLTNRFGKEAGIAISKNKPRGTIVKFSIPIEH